MIKSDSQPDEQWMSDGVQEWGEAYESGGSSEEIYTNV